jgi:hypothetical protein
MLSRNRRQFLLDAFALPLISKMWRAQGAAESVHSYREEMPDMLLSYFAQKTNALAAEWAGEEQDPDGCRYGRSQPIRP